MRAKQIASYPERIVIVKGGRVHVKRTTKGCFCSPRALVRDVRGRTGLRRDRQETETTETTEAKSIVAGGLIDSA